MINRDYTPPDTPLDLVHLDEHLLIANKPAGLLSVPGRGEARADSLLTRLQAVYPDTLLVHRLDQDTSGLIVFGRNRLAQANLGQQFEKRTIKKRYVARVWGQMQGESGKVDLPLIVNWLDRPRQHVNFETGKPSQTDWKVIAREPGETRVQLMPRTGRTHQLRLHMQAIGHPILGDDLYAEGPVRDDYPRLMLHAEGLKMAHPATGAALRFVVECPF